MNLLVALCFILFSTASGNFNFMDHFSEYSFDYDSSSSTQKSLYISQQIELNWIDARRFCESNGLRLAKLSNGEVYSVVSGLKQYLTNRTQTLFFDGSKTQNQFLNCTFLDTSGEDLENIVKEASCTENTKKFLCEIDNANIKIVDVQINSFSQLSETQKFMKPLGIFTDDTSKTLKSYFMSGTDLKLTAAQAVMFCQSIDMKLATPQNQEEYTNLRNLLRDKTNKYDNLLIEAYRSEKDESVWMSSGKKINYTINFDQFYFNDANWRESCLVFIDNTTFMLDINCTEKSQFICEKTQFSRVKQVKNEDSNKILDPFVSYYYETTRRTISKSLFLSQPTVRFSWIDAQMYCKSLGWNLFVPESEIERNKVQNRFNDIEILPVSFHVGITKMESRPNEWYSIATGNNINYGLNWVNNVITDLENHCGKYEIFDGYYSFIRTNCNDEKARFMCQKVYNYGNDIDESENMYDAEETFNYVLWKNNYFQGSEEKTEEQSALSTSNNVEKSLYTCDRSQDFFDHEGQYIKTACMVFTDKRNGESCIDDGMKLFILETSNMTTQLLEFATSIFGSNRGSTLWINGNKLSDGFWYTFDPLRKDLLQIKGVTHYGEEEEESTLTRRKRSHQTRRKSNQQQIKSCLVIEATNNFTVSPWVCGRPMYSVCQYDKNTNLLDQQTTSATIVSQSLQGFRLDICDKTVHLVSQSGYEKSLCFVKQNLTYDEADNVCKFDGMKLFTKSFDLIDKLLQVSKTMFYGIKESNIDLWVEGKFRYPSFKPEQVCYAMFYDRNIVDFFMDRCENRKPFLCEYFDGNI